MTEFEKKMINVLIHRPKSRDLGDPDKKGLEEQEKERFAQDTKQRHLLVIWMIIVISGWLICVILFTAFNNPWCLKISDTVLVTLLATTTANVLGLPAIILKDLFGGRRYRKPSQNNKNKSAI